MKVKIPHNPANEGDLASHGYSLSKSAPARHRALSKADRVLPVHKILHELEALAIRMRNSEDPKSYEERAWADFRWFEARHHIPKRR
ncbi:MAG: hypothetical protein KGI26_04755 [Thaumarchaeota archaeon]|nr:hypothetical protein [Nitrososphaerota archaeon]